MSDIQPELEQIDNVAPNTVIKDISASAEMYTENYRKLCKRVCFLRKDSF